MSAAKIKPAPPKPRSRRWLWLAVIALLALAAVCFLKIKSPGASGATVFALEPQEKTFAGYAGSTSCQSCHAAEFSAWAGSHHGRAERLPDAADETAFAPPRTFSHGTQKTSLRETNGHYEMISAGLRGTNETFRVQRVLAENPLRQMLVAFPGGRWQATEAAFDPRSNAWFNVYGDEDRKPGEWGHWTGRGMNWNSMCATCHNTRVRKNYATTTDTYHTAMVENGVGCEACHGPLRAHNDWQAANKNKKAKDPTVKKLSRDQTFDTCAGCHSRRAEITGDPRPGENFFDHHLLSITDESDFFYADGQIRDEDYEVTAFMGSKMFQHGVRCLDCHDIHTAKIKLPGNLMCLSCHSVGQTNAPAINPVTHSHHQVFGFNAAGTMTNLDLTTYGKKSIAQTGGECVSCHMPTTTYMQRHARHDHGFTIPDPLLTKQFGIPNACERCHADKGTDWNLKYVEQWYGTNMNRPYRQHAQTVARARSGDDAALTPLVQMLESDGNFYWRSVAANLLQRWSGEPSVTAALTEKLSDTNALVRQMAVQSLAPLIEQAEVKAALQNKLQDRSRNVRVEAARVLAATLDTNSLAGGEYLHFLDHISDQPLGQLQRGGFELQRGDAINALKHFQTAAQWDAFSPGIRHELAMILSQMGRSADAVKELEAAVKLAPRDAEFHYKLALALNETGDREKVLAELETALKLDPHHARAGYNLGLARHAAGNSAGAIQALLAAEAADPHDSRIPYARATIHAQLGEFEMARTAAQRALELNPQSTEAAALLQGLQGR